MEARYLKLVACFRPESLQHSLVVNPEISRIMLFRRDKWASRPQVNNALIKADHDGGPEEQRRFALVNNPRHLFADLAKSTRVRDT
jgi:hypothetical protein